MWFSKKEVKVEEKKVEKRLVHTTNRLTIIFTDGHSTWFQIDDTDSKRQLIEPWRDFFTWYYSKESPYFTLRIENGALVVRRDLIARFSVTRHHEVIRD